jgi:hypothetical protein
MRGAATFDDLLEEQLGTRPAPTGPHPVSSRVGTAASYGFFFGDAQARTIDVRPQASQALFGSAEAVAGMARATPHDVHAGAVPLGRAHVSRATRFEPAPPAPANRPRSRKLTFRERQAVEAFASLGVTLPADFTAAQLRTAFRELARRYHPDRHAGSGDVEKAILATLFGHAHDAYRVLARAALA